MSLQMAKPGKRASISCFFVRISTKDWKIPFFNAPPIVKRAIEFMRLQNFKNQPLDPVPLDRGDLKVNMPKNV